MNCPAKLLGFLTRPKCFKEITILAFILSYRYYEAKDGKCKECSFCCGSNWEQNKNIEPQCRNQRQGRCICNAASSTCNQTCSAPTTVLPMTTPKMTTSAPKTTPKMTTPASESKTTISAKTSQSGIEKRNSGR